MFETRERRRTKAVGDIVPVLARQILADFEPLSRLPTVRELARQHGTSVSSLHVAIGRLEDAGAIQIETRGRLGAFLLDRSIARLWTLSEDAPLVIAMPLASSPRYEGLATAIKQVLTQAGFEVFLVFVRGSRQRLQATHDGRSHMATMSSFAASELCGPEDSILVELAPNSYNTGHRVFLSERTGNRRPLRVIVDRHSADQQLLTALEFPGSDVEQVPAMTSQIARVLEDGRADAAIWTIDEMQVRWPAGIIDRPLSPDVLARIGDSDTRAVLVGKSSRGVLKAVATAIIKSAEVERIQLDVMARRVIAEY